MRSLWRKRIADCLIDRVHAGSDWYAGRDDRPTKTTTSGLAADRKRQGTGLRNIIDFIGPDGTIDSRCG
jgi:hypothetical protein